LRGENEFWKRVGAANENCVGSGVTVQISGQIGSIKKALEISGAMSGANGLSAFQLGIRDKLRNSVREAEIQSEV
jgi:hypothetical protein